MGIDKRETALGRRDRALLWLVRRLVREEQRATATATSEGMERATQSLGRQIDVLTQRLTQRLDATEAAMSGRVTDYTEAMSEALAVVGEELRTVRETLAAGHPSGWRAERLVEDSYALRALAPLRAPAPVLVVGGCERTLPAAAASLGLAVTLLDVRPPSIPHPGVTWVDTTVAAWPAATPRFAAIACMSGRPVADAAAVARMHDLLERDGLLVLSLPFPDDARPERLLEGWEVLDRSAASAVAGSSWSVTTAAATAGIVLLTARRPRERR